MPESGEEVIVTHKLSLGQIFKSPGLQHREILRGEIFKFRMSPGRLHSVVVLRRFGRRFKRNEFACIG